MFLSVFLGEIYLCYRKPFQWRQFIEWTDAGMWRLFSPRAESSDFLGTGPHYAAAMSSSCLRLTRYIWKLLLNTEASTKSELCLILCIQDGIFVSFFHEETGSENVNNWDFSWLSSQTIIRKPNSGTRKALEAWLSTLRYWCSGVTFLLFTVTLGNWGRLGIFWDRCTVQAIAGAVSQLFCTYFT